MITYSENILEEEKRGIAEILPEWETHVLHLHRNASDGPEQESLNFLVAINSRDEFNQWLTQFQERTQTTYSITSTGPGKGKRVILSLRLSCHRNTRCERTYTPEEHNRTKNTNCPSKMIVTIFAVRGEKCRNRGKFAEISQIHRRMPCEVVLILNHNHSITSADSLSFRRPSSEVKETLKCLFERGHSPATALHCIKTDIQLNYPDYPSVLGDRSKCPAYEYCYHSYSKIPKKKKKKLVTMDFNIERKELLQQRLEEYNTEVGSVCSKMVVKDDHYIICICSPMMQRVHKYIKAASKVVLMCSIGNLDRDESRIFLLLTHSEGGGLPLGIIVTTSDSCEALEIGLNILKDLVGENIFGSNICGPSIFLTNDSQSEQNAIRRCFPNSKIFLSVFHVLQAVWRWLMKSTNGIPREKQTEFFHDFKKIMFAKTESDAELNYNVAKGNICDKHQNYAKYLEGYWAWRELWAISYRRGTFVERHNTNNISEDLMRILKDKIFERVQSFNFVQIVDFILTNVNLYFQKRLLSAANRASSTFNCRPFKAPSQEILTNIKKFNDDILLVPSEDMKNCYTVNLAVLICSCIQGNFGKICNHIDWAGIFSPSESYMEVIDSDRKCETYYFIATGEQPPENWVEHLPGSQRVTELIDHHHSVIMCEEEVTCETAEEIVDTMHVEEVIHTTNDDLIRGIQALLTDFSNRSPGEMREGLETMHEELQRVKTPSACASLLLKLRKEPSRINQDTSNYLDLWTDIVHVEVTGPD